LVVQRVEVNLLKRTLLFAIAFVFLFSIASGQVSEKRDMAASSLDPQILVVTLELTPTEGTARYDVAELYPQGWQLAEWKVSGNSTPVSFEQQPSTYKGETVTLFHWNFSDSGPVTLTYGVRTGRTTAGEEQLVSVIVYPGGFSTNTFLLTIGEGGIVQQAVNIQPIVVFRELSSIIVALIFVVLVAILVYYVLKMKRAAPPSRPEAPTPTAAAPVAVQKPERPAVFRTLGLPIIGETRPKAGRKKKRAARPKGTKFYKKTLRRLERIERSLKKRK
jgi:hypothetical protein